MLEHNADHDRLFDTILRRSIPFMIFAPQSFTAQLAAKLGGLWRHYASHDSVGDGDFLVSVEDINKMLDAAIRDILDPETVVIISDFTLQRSSFNNRLIRLEQEVRDIRRAIAKLPAEKRKPKEKALSPSPASAPASFGLTPAPTTSISIPAPTPEPRRGRPPKVDGEEIQKLTAMLEARNRRPHTIDLYVSTARSILEKYNGTLPSDEQYKADILARGRSEKYANDKLNHLRLLREAISLSLSKPEQKKSELKSESVGANVEPAFKKEFSTALTIPTSATRDAQERLSSRCRIERLKRMAEHYHEGDLLTMDEVRTFAQKFSEDLTKQAIDGTLRAFMISGYAEKLPQPYTYRRTGKQWDGAGYSKDSADQR